MAEWKEKLPRWLRKTLLAVLIAAVAGGAVYGVLLLIRSGSDAVNVYDGANVAMLNASASNAESGGNVTADRVQSVYVSATQQVTRIHVTEGQTVKAGDPILTFDTTLTDLELERQSIAVRQLELDLENAKKEQAKINTYRVSGSRGSSGGGEDTSDEPSALRLIRQGTGTEEDPIVIIWNDTCEIDESFLNLLFTQYGERVWVVFEERSGDAVKGSLLRNWELALRYNGGSWSFSLVQPNYTDQSEQGTTTSVDYGISYSYADLVRLKQEAAQKIQKLELDLKVAKVKYDTLQYELSNGAVTSQIDGVVKTVLDPDTALEQNKPVVLISGGGGYFVTGALSETELSGMHVGDKVSVMSWENYTNVDGEIREISEYPLSDNDYGYHYSDGNQNVTLYPFTVFINEDAGLREGEYVQISYSPASEGGSGVYLMKPFVRSENGVSYIWCAGADGKLERRTVTTGRSLWGSYIEIIGDFDVENDAVAFPYGRNLRVGARTQRADINALYGY